MTLRCNLTACSPCLTGPVDYPFASRHKGAFFFSHLLLTFWGRLCCHCWNNKTPKITDWLSGQHMLTPWRGTCTIHTMQHLHPPHRYCSREVTLYIFSCTNECVVSPVFASEAFQLFTFNICTYTRRFSWLYFRSDISSTATFVYSIRWRRSRYVFRMSNLISKLSGEKFPRKVME